MTDPNARQVGGAHYKTMIYQHWDWVTDIGLPYLLGCATKYICRWRQKNGVQDLEKAIHYLEKAKERKIQFLNCRDDSGRLTRVFLAQLPEAEADAVQLTLRGSYDSAIACVQAMIADTPTPE